MLAQQDARDGRFHAVAGSWSIRQASHLQSVTYPTRRRDDVTTYQSRNGLNHCRLLSFRCRPQVCLLRKSNFITAVHWQDISLKAFDLFKIKCARGERASSRSKPASRSSALKAPAIEKARQKANRSAYGIRTRVPALRGPCPRPLDECALSKSAI
jgi:hypothetical protein